MYINIYTVKSPNSGHPKQRTCIGFIADEMFSPKCGNLC